VGSAGLKIMKGLFLAGAQIWWERSNAELIPLGILVALALGLRVYGV
jgi:hypothetical protein